MSHTVPQYRDQVGGGYYLGRTYDEWLLSGGDGGRATATETVAGSATGDCSVGVISRFSASVGFVVPLLWLRLTATG